MVPTTQVRWTEESRGKILVGMDPDRLVVSPDSQHVAYRARKGKNWMVVVDGQEGPEYDGFLRGSELVFDDERHLHALAHRGGVGGEAFLVKAEVVGP